MLGRISQILVFNQLQMQVEGVTVLGTMCFQDPDGYVANLLSIAELNQTRKGVIKCSF